MNEARSQLLPGVTDEFLSLLRPIGSLQAAPQAAGDLIAADGEAVAIASRSGGTPVFGFGPQGETVMLPGDFFLSGTLILDGGRAWGVLVSGGRRSLVMWEANGSMRDLLKEAGLRAYGSGMPAVANPWVAWFTAEQPLRVALLNVDSGELHFVAKPVGSLGINWSAQQLCADANGVKLIYRVATRPGEMQFELYDSKTEISTTLDLAANSLMSDGTRLMWVQGMTFSPAPTAPDPAHAPSLVCAPWSDVTQQRTLGHPIGRVQAAHGQVAWLEAGGVLKVDDGATHVLASGLQEPFIESVGADGIAYRSGGQLHLWTRDRGTRLFARDLALPVLLSRSHLFVAAPRQPRMGERQTIFAMPLSTSVQVPDEGRAVNTIVHYADASPIRTDKPFTPSRSPEAHATSPVTAESVIDRLERLMATRFPQATQGCLRPPANGAQLDAVEAAIGQRLPDDIRALYLRHDGTVLPQGRSPDDRTVPPLLLPFSHWCSLDDMLRTWQRLQSLAQPSSGGMAEEGMPLNSLVYQSAWIPIGISNTSESVFIDLDPTAWGTRGQVLRHAFDDEPTMLAASLIEYLHKLLSFAEQGLIEAHQGSWLDADTREPVFRLD